MSPGLTPHHTGSWERAFRKQDSTVQASAPHPPPLAWPEGAPSAQFQPVRELPRATEIIYIITVHLKLTQHHVFQGTYFIFTDECKLSTNMFVILFIHIMCCLVVLITVGLAGEGNDKHFCDLEAA